MSKLPIYFFDRIDMTNYAFQNKDELSKTNYVRIASPNTDYWVDFSYDKLKK